MRWTIEISFKENADGDNKIDCENFEKALTELLNRVKVHGHTDVEKLSYAITDCKSDLLIGGTDVFIES